MNYCSLSYTLILLIGTFVAPSCSQNIDLIFLLSYPQVGLGSGGDRKPICVQMTLVLRSGGKLSHLLA